MVNQVLDSYSTQYYNNFKLEFKDGSQKVYSIEEIILNLRNQFPFYKKKLENRILEFEEIENSCNQIEG
jgi:mRNA-degrading endonuclease YafQ of YafQ-DinJ toxin-antitoxin module